MAAIMHCIVVGIENERLSNILRSWKMRKDIERNRKHAIDELNTLIEVYKTFYNYNAH